MWIATPASAAAWSEKPTTSAALDPHRRAMTSAMTEPDAAPITTVSMMSATVSSLMAYLFLKEGSDVTTVE